VNGAGSVAVGLIPLRLEVEEPAVDPDVKVSSCYSRDLAANTV
jgi:hypothetical protein